MTDSQPMSSPEVVCFGMITPARLLIVDRLPAWNTGTTWTDGSEFISDDAAIVAGLLVSWGVPTELVGTALGDDEAGRWAVRRLREMGVRGTFRLRDDIRTPFEVNVSDALGGRTYLWDRRPEVLATLDDADLSALDHAKLLYVDWYDSPYIVRAMNAAAESGVAVMLNVEHGHTVSGMLSNVVARSTICQAVTDAAQIGTDAIAVARTLIEAGVETALVTVASGGVVGVRGDEALHVQAPELKPIDTCGAGATFSAAYIASWLEGGNLEETLRFAVAAASLKCTRVGLAAFSQSEISSLAGSLDVRLMS